MIKMTSLMLQPSGPQVIPCSGCSAICCSSNTFMIAAFMSSTDCAPEIPYCPTTKNGTAWILLSFGYDPLSCPHCHTLMKILNVYYNHKRVSLEELYERAMNRDRAALWRSSA